MTRLLFLTLAVALLVVSAADARGRGALAFRGGRGFAPRININVNRGVAFNRGVFFARGFHGGYGHGGYGVSRAFFPSYGYSYGYGGYAASAAYIAPAPVVQQSTVTTYSSGYAGGVTAEDIYREPEPVPGYGAAASESSETTTTTTTTVTYAALPVLSSSTLTYLRGVDYGARVAFLGRIYGPVVAGRLVGRHFGGVGVNVGRGVFRGPARGGVGRGGVFRGAVRPPAVRVRVRVR